MASKSASKVKKAQGKAKKEISFPFERSNYIIIGIGIVVLVLGYILMAEDTVDGFWAMVVSPILLVLGYCVIIPYGIMKKSKTERQNQPEITENNAAAAGQVSSNIKTR
jgi:ABC-type Fe3+ transport system permease subunit